MGGGARLETGLTTGCDTSELRSSFCEGDDNRLRSDGGGTNEQDVEAGENSTSETTLFMQCQNKIYKIPIVWLFVIQ